MSYLIVASTYGWKDKSEENLQACNMRWQQVILFKRKDGEILKAATELQKASNWSSETIEAPNLIIVWILAK